MTSNPAMLIVVAVAAIVGVELLQRAFRCVMTVVPSESIVVVFPLALRLGAMAFFAVKVAYVAREVQGVMDAIDAIGRW